jgi:hypothetical protein
MSSLDWLAENGKAVLFGASGVIVGVLIAMPFGWSLPNPAAELLGAVSGAAATIGGAIVLWKMQERKTALHTLRAIQVYAEAHWNNAVNVGMALQNGDPGRIVKAITRGQAALANETGRVSRIHNQLHTLSADESSRFYEIESLAEEYVAFCEAIFIKVSGGQADSVRLAKWTQAMEKHREAFADLIRAGLAAANGDRNVIAGRWEGSDAADMLPRTGQESGG